MLNRINKECIIRFLGILFSLTLIVGYFVSLQIAPKSYDDLRFDEDLGAVPATAIDLAADIALMWRTVPQQDFPVSPVSAINAADRVFATVDLIGKATNEVFALIGHNKTSNDSGYNFPFFPVEPNTLVYRFDCGHFGLQFNLQFDASGNVTNFNRQSIY